ncbi:RNA polymerase sigma factor [Microlunatus soli]|uniref:RNA polymerase, sigma subunit, ECF family n=1 Tax=Microlunatus soli TaxID=630515 RepID=A0A1H1P313_9ACTN|nr:sigma-70 family RNA polymerase sigma factor [Microlunatus soli]SDS05621.1 RNA polymerase, sigma subunit, ECF family [Microlunatus soli]
MTVRPGSGSEGAHAVAEAHRREWAAVLAATVRVARDLDLAEECVQDAYVDALQAWTRDGVPDRPGAWLTTAARHNAIDALRRARTLRTKLPLLIEPGSAGDDAGAAELRHAQPETDGAVDDDRLRLIFLCCHPALAVEAQVALTLRLVCGVSTADVATAFLVSESTMAARITRAKRKISTAHIPFRMPAVDELPQRLTAALAVVYLLFTTGHTAPSGPALARSDLELRALELARLLHDLLPTEREVTGLLALIMVNHARQPGRMAPDGRLVLLADQDRTTWDRDQIAEADRLVLESMRGGAPGRYALQAAIATLHAFAPSYAETDWPQILQLYDGLLAVWPSSVVALNRAVAVGMVDGPAAALREVDRLAETPRLSGYRYLPAIRADLLRRLDRRTDALAAYTAALRLADNEAERQFLRSRIAELS